MMWGYPHSWWGWLPMTLGMPGFWALLIALVIAFVRRPDPPDQRRHFSPEEILAEGFARGELDADEYRERLRVLRSDRTHTPPAYGPAAGGVTWLASLWPPQPAGRAAPAGGRGLPDRRGADVVARRPVGGNPGLSRSGTWTPLARRCGC